MPEQKDFARYASSSSKHLYININRDKNSSRKIEKRQKKPNITNDQTSGADILFPCPFTSTIALD